MLTNTLPVADNANMRSQSLLPPAVLDPARVRDVARRHGLDAIRWWPPNQGDLLVEGLPVSLRSLRAELERALGCRVAIYLADCLAEETRDRIRRETVDLLAAPPAEPAPAAAGPGAPHQGRRRNQRRLRSAPPSSTTAAAAIAHTVRSTRCVRQPNWEPRAP